MSPDAPITPLSIDEMFLAALFPGSFSILGFRLRPYCLGHMAALLAIRSPFVAAAGSGARITGEDVVTALFVCSTPGWPILTPDRLRPRRRHGLLRWWLERKASRLRRAAEAFRAYQDAHCSFPAFYTNEPTVEDDDVPEEIPSALPVSAPFLISRVCSLVTRTSITICAAWQMPLALPSWIIGTLNEMEGGARFLDPSEDTKESLPPDVSQMSERELYQMAVKQLGKEKADEWRAVRRANRPNRPKQQRKKKGGTKS